MRRPNLTFILRRDMVLIRSLVLVAFLLPLNLGFSLGEIIDEFGRSLFEEIDYEREADNADPFGLVRRQSSCDHSGRTPVPPAGITTSWIRNKLRPAGGACAAARSMH